jgi:hypothetical protein
MHACSLKATPDDDHALMIRACIARRMMIYLGLRFGIDGGSLNQMDAIPRSMVGPSNQTDAIHRSMGLGKLAREHGDYVTSRRSFFRVKTFVPGSPMGSPFLVIGWEEVNNDD